MMQKQRVIKQCNAAEALLPEVWHEGSQTDWQSQWDTGQQLDSL